MSAATKLTVIQAVPALEFGGVERGALEIASYLVSKGHRSIVISAGGGMVDQLQREGSEHLVLPVGKKSVLSLSLISKLRSVFAETDASIVHARSRFPAWLCALALKTLHTKHGPRFVTTVHGTYSVNRYSKIMTKGEKVIAISEYIRKYILENYPHTDPDRIVLIPRGVDQEYFSHGYNPSEDWSRAWFEEFPETKDKKIIAFPGRITRRKGHEDFIEVINRLAPNEELHGLIIGGPHRGKQHYLGQLKSRIKTLGLSDRITFTGHRNDIREIISQSDIVLSLPVEPEAFGRTTLEALSLGVPVIAYNHGGSGEVLETIFPRGLVPVRDIGKTCEMAYDFINNPPKVQPQQSYTLQAMQDKTLLLYESLV